MMIIWCWLGVLLFIIYWFEVVVFIGLFVLDGDIVFVQISNVSVVLQKLQQFMDDGMQVVMFSCYQWEFILQVKMYLMIKNGKCFGFGMVVFLCVFVEYFLYQF